MSEFGRPSSARDTEGCDGALDAVIDAAARSLTSAPVPLDLTSRVAARVRRGGRGAWSGSFWPALAGRAAIVAIAIAAAVFIRQWQPGETPAERQPRRGSSFAESKPDTTTPARVEPSALNDPSGVPQASSPTSTSSNGSQSGVAARVRVERPLPPGYESIALSEFALPPLTVDTLEPIEALDLAAEPIDSIALDALGFK